MPRDPRVGMSHGTSHGHPAPAPPEVDQRRFRAAGLATSIVAALIALVGVVVARGIFKVALLDPPGDGVWGGAGTVAYAFIAFSCGIGATWLLFLLLRTTPSPIVYFGWIVGLVTAFAAVIPLTMSSDFGKNVATTLINAAIGLAVGSLTVSAARRSILYAPPSESELQPPYI